MIASETEWNFLEWLQFDGNSCMPHQAGDPTLGIQIRYMKMVFNFYCTWRWATFEKLMMKIYDIFIRLIRIVTPYNIVQKSLRRWKIFYT